MTTESQRRIWISRTLAGATAAVVVVFLLIEFARGSDYRKATEWHRVRGNVIQVNGHKLSLPQDWWERDSSAGGKRLFVKASRSLLKTWQTGIIIDRKGPNEIKADEATTRKTLEMMIRVGNQGKQTPISSLVVVKAASTKIYCLKSIIVEPMIELRCDWSGHAHHLCRNAGHGGRD